MIYVFLAEGFEEVEALATVDVLRRAGLEVATVGVTGSLVSGSHKITVQTDLTLEQAEMNRDLDAVVLPGGMPGAGVRHLRRAEHSRPKGYAPRAQGLLLPRF